MQVFHWGNLGALGFARLGGELQLRNSKAKWDLLYNLGMLQLGTLGLPFVAMSS